RAARGRGLTVRVGLLLRLAPSGPGGVRRVLRRLAPSGAVARLPDVPPAARAPGVPGAPPLGARPAGRPTRPAVRRRRARRLAPSPTAGGDRGAAHRVGRGRSPGRDRPSRVPPRCGGGGAAG